VHVSATKLLQETNAMWDEDAQGERKGRCDGGLDKEGGSEKLTSRDINQDKKSSINHHTKAKGNWGKINQSV